MVPRPLWPNMTDSLLVPRHELLYKRYHTGQLSVQIRLPLLPVPRTKRGPSLGSMFNFSE